LLVPIVNDLFEPLLAIEVRLLLLKTRCLCLHELVERGEFLPATRRGGPPLLGLTGFFTVLGCVSDHYWAVSGLEDVN